MRHGVHVLGSLLTRPGRRRGFLVSPSKRLCRAAWSIRASISGGMGLMLAAPVPGAPEGAARGQAVSALDAAPGGIIVSSGWCSGSRPHRKRWPRVRRERRRQPWRRTLVQERGAAAALRGSAPGGLAEASSAVISSAARPSYLSRSAGSHRPTVSPPRDRVDSLSARIGRRLLLGQVERRSAAAFGAAAIAPRCARAATGRWPARAGDWRRWRSTVRYSRAFRFRHLARMRSRSAGSTVAGAPGGFSGSSDGGRRRRARAPSPRPTRARPRRAD